MYRCQLVQSKTCLFILSNPSRLFTLSSNTTFVRSDKISGSTTVIFGTIISSYQASKPFFSKKTLSPLLYILYVSEKVHQFHSLNSKYTISPDFWNFVILKNMSKPAMIRTKTMIATIIQTMYFFMNFLK